MGAVDDIAYATLFLASDLAAFITDATLFVDGGVALIDATADSRARAVQRTGL